MYSCSHCDKTYQHKRTLDQHIRLKHNANSLVECIHCGLVSRNQADHVKHVRENHGYHDGIRDVYVPPRSAQLEKSMQKAERKRSREEVFVKEFKETGEAFNVTTTTEFKFKHPFCMMVAGPSRSGKTQWVAKLLQERQKRIYPIPGRIVYCYAHWQDKYTELKNSAPSTHFNKGLPHAYFLKQLENCVIVIDDLMDVAMKEPAVMSIFTEGSHHKNVSVIFLSQNIFHQGKHSRTMSLNVQYMILFKNARDRVQVQTLARQMFPTDWRSFLQYFENETSKPFGHVIIDLHPSTQDDKRIVSIDYKEPIETTSYSEQYHKLSNPFAQPLMETSDKHHLIANSNMSAEEKVQSHVEALKEFQILKEKYDEHERRKRRVPETPQIKSDDEVQIKSEGEDQIKSEGEEFPRKRKMTPLEKIRRNRKPYLTEDDFSTEEEKIKKCSTGYTSHRSH